MFTQILKEAMAQKHYSLKESLVRNIDNGYKVSVDFDEEVEYLPPLEDIALTSGVASIGKDGESVFIDLFLDAVVDDGKIAVKYDTTDSEWEADGIESVDAFFEKAELTQEKALDIIDDMVEELLRKGMEKKLKEFIESKQRELTGELTESDTHGVTSVSVIVDEGSRDVYDDYVVFHGFVTIEVDGKQYEHNHDITFYDQDGVFGYSDVEDMDWGNAWTDTDGNPVEDDFYEKLDKNLYRKIHKLAMQKQNELMDSAKELLDE